MEFIDESELDPVGGYEVVSELDLDPIAPDSTGSFGGDLLDTIGGASKGYLSGFGGGLAELADLGASALASGVRSAQTGDLQWLDSDVVANKYSELLNDFAGDLGKQSAAGRIGERAGELGGTAASFLAGGGVLGKAGGKIGKVGEFLASNPKRQALMSVLGGAAGQGAVEADLVDQGGMGQLGVELATMTAPDLARAGLSGARGLGRYFYQSGDEAANEVMKTVAGTLDDASVLTRPATSASAQVAREEGLGELVKTARNIAGQEKEEALKGVYDLSSEAGQLTDELSFLKRKRWSGTAEPVDLARIKNIEATLESIPATRVVDEGFPLVNEKYGDFVKGTAKVEAPNEVKAAIDTLASKKAEFSEMATDLYKVFRTGKFAGRGVSLDDYQQAASKIGNRLTDGQTAKTFKEVMGKSPEAMSLGKTSVLQNLFSGTPTSWANKINKSRGALQELFDPEQLKAIEKVATKNKGVVGGAIIANAARFFDNRIMRYGILGNSAYFGGPVGILGGIALNKAASAIARKPDVMQQAISSAFQNPEVAKIMTRAATPANLKAAKDYFTNAGKLAMMGISGDKENETIDMDSGFIPEKKSEEIRATPDVDLTPPKVEPSLMNRLIKAESGGNPLAIGPATKYGKAKGLTQLLDSTGREWHKKLGLSGEYDPFNKEQNKAIGEAYLGHLIDKYGDTKLALAAYNWGMGNLNKLIERKGTKDFDKLVDGLPAETKNYVAKITKV